MRERTILNLRGGSGYLDLYTTSMEHGMVEGGGGD